MQERLLTVVLFLFALISALFVNNYFLVDKVTNKVIENLKREYVPGPYEPGFDPDKVPPLKN